MKNKLWKKEIVLAIVLLFIGANFVTVATSMCDEVRYDSKGFSDVEPLMPDARYLVIGTITGLHQQDGLIKFYVGTTIFIKFNPFSLKTYHGGFVEMKPYYLGIVLLHFIFAVAQITLPSQANNLLKENLTYDVLPGKTPPVIVFGHIKNLDTRGSITFDTTKRTWYVKWDYPFPRNFTIAPYNNGEKIHICPPMYFRLISPRFVFIIARGMEFYD